MYTLEDCIRQWDEAGQHGAPEERVANSRLWEPYYSFLAENFTEPTSVLSLEKEMTEYLVREEILSKERVLLDIGAGMGGFTLCFAEVCRQVDALESVGACTEVLKKRANHRGRSNIRVIHGFWEEFIPDKRYDVTFSSMCPAICSVEELRRMEAMTEKTCCLVAVQRGSYDKHRKAMMEGLGVKPKGGMATEAIHYINALYLMGRQPNLKFVQTKTVTRVPLEQAMERYSAYFRIFGVSDEAGNRFLDRYLQENASDGYIEEESLLRQALIWWNV